MAGGALAHELSCCFRVKFCKGQKMNEVDWPSILEDLRGALGNDAEVARRAGCNQTTALRLRIGVAAEPFYGLGARFLELHRKHVGKKKKKAA
jgi:hypothetical protein